MLFADAACAELRQQAITDAHRALIAPTSPVASRKKDIGLNDTPPSRKRALTSFPAAPSSPSLPSASTRKRKPATYASRSKTVTPAKPRFGSQELSTGKKATRSNTFDSDLLPLLPKPKRGKKLLPLPVSDANSSPRRTAAFVVDLTSDYLTIPTQEKMLYDKPDSTDPESTIPDPPEVYMTSNPASDGVTETLLNQRRLMRAHRAQTDSIVMGQPTGHAIASEWRAAKGTPNYAEEQQIEVESDGGGRKKKKAAARSKTSEKKKAAPGKKGRGKVKVTEVIVLDGSAEETVTVHQDAGLDSAATERQKVLDTPYSKDSAPGRKRSATRRDEESDDDDLSSPPLSPENPSRNLAEENAGLAVANRLDQKDPSSDSDFHAAPAPPATKRRRTSTATKQQSARKKSTTKKADADNQEAPVPAQAPFKSAENIVDTDEEMEELAPAPPPAPNTTTTVLEEPPVKPGNNEEEEERSKAEEPPSSSSSKRGTNGPIRIPGGGPKMRVGLSKMAKIPQLLSQFRR